MNRRIISAVFLATMLASPFILQCGNFKPPIDVPGVPKCPDANVESVLAFDFQKEFSLQAEGATKLKAGVVAAMEMKDIAAKIDADLKTACSGIANDLGTKGNYADGKTACDAALKSIGDVKAKLGASAKIGVVMKPPVCRADMNVMADCAGKCDAKVKGGSAKVECEPGKLSGTCDASCEGKCDVQAGAKCDGECQGTCDAEIKGSCSGTCDGKCDGKNGKGACSGTCEGKCEGGSIQGSCKGKCGGSCQVKAAAKCEGTCTGKCSAEMKAPKCTGEVKPPEMSAECKAQCNASVTAKAECTPATFGITVVGAADAKLAADFKAALEKNLPLVLKVAIGMKDQVVKIGTSGKAVVEGVLSGTQEIAAQAGGKAAMVGGQITACFGATLKGAGEAAGSIQGNVDVSVKVQASASASGSASSK